MSSLVLSLALQISMLAAVSDNTISNNAVSNNTVSNSAVSNNTVANAAAGTVPSSPAIHAASNNYADAYKDTQENGKPLVILVGASWCPACQAMKTSVMPTVAAQGGLANVAFAYVNTDAQGDLAGKLMEGGLIPQLVMYEKEADGWKLKRLVGVQSVEAVQDFLGPAVKAALAAKQSGTQQPTATQPASATKQPTAAQQSTPLQHSAAG